MQEILSNIDSKIYISIAVLIVGIIIYILIKNSINRMIKKDKISSRKKKTYLKLFSSIVKYALVIFAAIIILQINGVDVTSLAAGLGIISLTVGLALQDALKDIVMGMNIIIDHYFAVGDVLKIDDVEGKVVALGLKSTKMKDINTGNIYTIANRNIDRALNISKQLDVDIPFPYELSVERVEEIINSITEKVSKLDGIIEVYYKGLNEFADSAIYYKLRSYCEPDLKPQLRRDINRIVKLELDSNNIAIPYKQIDIHTKN